MDGDPRTEAVHAGEADPLSKTDERRWPRPVPTIGDRTSAVERQANPRGWALSGEVAEALSEVIEARRDIRRFRPDPVPDELLRQVLEAGHRAPSVGHSQPWRFIVVRDPAVRDRAAYLADRARLRQANDLEPDRAARLLDLKLEGLREAPLGVVVTCDRRTPAAGVLGRATFPDADLWSCACAIQNMWLTARAVGLGMGWVTLFEPADLAALLHLPDGVVTLGWLCLGWPDERPPAPGLERAAWSRRLPLDSVVLQEHWPDEDGPQMPVSHLRAPAPGELVGATDAADELLTPPEALGVLDRALNRIVAIGGADLDRGELVLVGADHPVAALGVSAYPASVTRDVLEAAVAGRSVGIATASASGLASTVIDAGVDGPPVRGARDLRASGPRGDLASGDALSPDAVLRLIEEGRAVGSAGHGIVALGEVGVGNTTVAAALTCAVLGIAPEDTVGLGAGSDAEIVQRKIHVVRKSLSRKKIHQDPIDLLAALGGPEFAVLTGVVLGAVAAGMPVVLDGLATSIAALLAVRTEPSVQAYLVAGQVSRERAHALVLRELGLEPLLSLRLRAGEGVGACLATSMLLQGLQVRRTAARTV
ncbi:5,6-dimethylbenzimidazole synthase [Calidifontibacter sp. DB0510]|uniref:Nicotinate-nucleotide--dimethylbenzimidazole phosphoribosyltransferase n=1 Tax=Metallococcus carri TaxID=1656884 RepID=A0A967AYC0_9MICO|nr:5,6-dimethylbenzimidazole synthase [Metallococcus carri]NHN54682.1 5,6-dimethylbenzimidazole synthase [Metallococcus carri]NOP37027.1 5,6-dimethylbenzimidazole synthase [Calidifontibacter sp. DB2511S]